MANDYGHLGIKANTVSPAFTDSPMTHASFQVPGLTDAFLPRYPMGRLNTVDDVAHACLTGANIQPNGGLIMRGNPQAHDVAAAVGAAMAKLQG